MGHFRRATETVAASACLIAAPDGLIDPDVLANRFDQPAQTQFAQQTTTEDRLSSIRVGPHTYRLLRALQLECVRLAADRWRCFARGLRGIEGEGRTSVESKDAFCVNVHTAFQQLYTTRPFEMTDDQRQRWRRLCSVIDILSYREETPVTIRQLGRIISAPLGSTRRVRWIHKGVDVISVLSSPAEFAGYGTGQWFDAVVRKDLRTGNVVGIAHSQRMDAPPAVSRDAAAEYFQALPIERLPGKAWEW